MLNRRPIAVLALLGFGAIYSTQYLGLSHRWWFEDDPTLLASAATIHNPISIFTDPTILRHFSSSAALVPMQVFSYWADVQLAGFSPGFAYGHQVFSFLLTLVLFYLFLAWRFPDNRTAALVACLVWALLPATAVIVQFVGTRHYLEGLLFSMLTLYLAERLSDNQGHLPWWGLGSVLICGSVAMLYKEIYPPVVSLLLLATAWRRRDLRLGILTIALALGYGLYRTWVFGLDFKYGGIPLLTPGQFLKFLAKLPYTFASNYGGYWVVAMVIGLCVYAWIRQKESRGMLLCLLGMVALSLVAILPASFPLYGMIRRPDPWYRLVFLLNTILVGFGVAMAVRYARPWFQGVLAVVALAALIPGVAKTHALWTDLTASAEREGKFYLSNPDKMLLSEQEASWFIPGLNWMYEVRPSHYVWMKDRATTQIPPDVPVWRFLDGRYVPEGRDSNK